MHNLINLRNMVSNKYKIYSILLQKCKKEIIHLCFRFHPLPQQVIRFKPKFTVLRLKFLIIKIIFLKKKQKFSLLLNTIKLRNRVQKHSIERGIKAFYTNKKKSSIFFYTFGEKWCILSFIFNFMSHFYNIKKGL